MNQIKTYKEYLELYNSESAKIMRAIDKKIEDDHGGYNFEDSKQHNALKSYLNKYYLWGKLTQKQFEEYLLKIKLGNES